MNAINITPINPRRRLDDARARLATLEQRLEALRREQAATGQKRNRQLDATIRELESSVDMARDVIELATENAAIAGSARDEKISLAIKAAPGALSRIESAARQIDEKARDIADLITSIHAEAEAIAPVVSSEDIKSIMRPRSIGCALAEAGLEQWLPYLAGNGSDRRTCSTLISMRLKPLIRNELTRLKSHKAAA